MFGPYGVGWDLGGFLFIHENSVVGTHSKCLAEALLMSTSIIWINKK